MRELAERIQRGRRAIAEAKRRGMDTAEWEAHLKTLFDEAGKEPLGEGVEPWMLWEWRRQSIPQWRAVLDESVRAGTKGRERYARWMLRDVLLDPDYDEAQP